VVPLPEPSQPKQTKRLTCEQLYEGLLLEFGALFCPAAAVAIVTKSGLDSPRYSRKSKGNPRISHNTPSVQNICTGSENACHSKTWNLTIGILQSPLAVTEAFDYLLLLRPRPRPRLTSRFELRVDPHLGMDSKFETATVHICLSTSDPCETRS